MKVIVAIGVVMAVAMLVVPPSALAKGEEATAKAQLQTAIFHAGELAQRGTAVAAAKTHLQHVLNCLDGPKATTFNAAVGDVCKGQGNGIIPDLTAAQAAGVAGAEKALRFVKAGRAVVLEALKSDDVNLVQPYAAVVANQFKLAVAALP